MNDSDDNKDDDRDDTISDNDNIGHDDDDSTNAITDDDNNSHDEVFVMMPKVTVTLARMMVRITRMIPFLFQE